MVLTGSTLKRVRVQAQSLHISFPLKTPRDIAKIILEGQNPPEVTLDSLRKTVSKAIGHFKKTGQFGGDARKGKSGRPRTVRTPGFIKKLKNASKAKRGKSTRKLSAKFGVSQQLVHKTLTDDIGFSPFRRSKESRLQPHHIIDRLRSARALRKHIGKRPEDWENVINTDFSGKIRLVRPLNSKNDVIWASSKEGQLKVSGFETFTCVRTLVAYFRTLTELKCFFEPYLLYYFIINNRNTKFLFL